MLGLESLIDFMGTFSMSNIHSFYNAKVISFYYFLHYQHPFVFKNVQLAVLDSKKKFKVTFKQKSVFDIYATSRPLKSKVIEI